MEGSYDFFLSLSYSDGLSSSYPMGSYEDFSAAAFGNDVPQATLCVDPVSTLKQPHLYMDASDWSSISSEDEEETESAGQSLALPQSCGSNLLSNDTGPSSVDVAASLEPSQKGIDNDSKTKPSTPGDDSSDDSGSEYEDAKPGAKRRRRGAKRERKRPTKAKKVETPDARSLPRTRAARGRAVEKTIAVADCYLCPFPHPEDSSKTCSRIYGSAGECNRHEWYDHAKTEYKRLTEEHVAPSRLIYGGLPYVSDESTCGRCGQELSRPDAAKRHKETCKKKTKPNDAAAGDDEPQACGTQSTSKAQATDDETKWVMIGQTPPRPGLRPRTARVKQGPEGSATRSRALEVVEVTSWYEPRFNVKANRKGATRYILWTPEGQNGGIPTHTPVARHNLYAAWDGAKVKASPKRKK